MTHRLPHLIASALALALGAVAATAEESKRPPEPDRLVIRARLPLPPAAPAASASPASPAPSAPSARPDAPVVTVTTDETPARAFTAAVTVGDGGVVEAVVAAERLGVAGCIEFRPAGGTGGAVIAFRDELRGEADLGAIAFGDRCPVLVAGRVETAQKKPVAGAAVNVRFQVSPRTTLRFAGIAATTDANGAYTIRADVRGRRGVMFTETEGRWQTAVPASLLAPAKDVRLVAAPAAEVRGTVEVPEGLDPAELVVDVSGAAGSVKSAVLDGERCTPGGEFERLTFAARSPFVLRGLVPGRYGLRLRFRDGTQPLADVRDVTVGDATTELPALRVAGPVRRVLVHVVGPDGAPAAGAEVWAREAGDGGKFRAMTAGADGTVRVAYLGESVSLAAHAPGTSWAFAAASGDDVKLQVARLPGTPVRVLLPDKALRGGGELEAAVVLSWRADADVLRSAVARERDDTDPRETEAVELPFPAQDPPEGVVPLPGWYEVALRVRAGGRTMSRPLAPVRIAGETLLLVPLDMSADEINEIVRSVAGR